MIYLVNDDESIMSLIQASCSSKNVFQNMSATQKAMCNVKALACKTGGDTRRQLRKEWFLSLA